MMKTSGGTSNANERLAISDGAEGTFDYQFTSTLENYPCSHLQG